MASTVHQASRQMSKHYNTPFWRSHRYPRHAWTRRPYSNSNSPHPHPRSGQNLTIGIATALAISGVSYTYFLQRDQTRSLAKSLPATPQPFYSQASKPTTPISSVIPVTPKELAADILGQHVCRNARNQATQATLLLSPEQCSQILRANEESFRSTRGNGVLRYDRTQVASNDPIEDDYSEKLLEWAGGDWMFWGIYDGHRGFATSAKLRQALIPYVYQELEAIQKLEPSGPDAKSIDSTISSAFVKLDDEITYKSVDKVLAANSRKLASHLLSPAISGSCALLSFYDTRTQLFRVACSGDSRAVLGRKDPNGLWTATALSVDQTGDNAEEAERIRREHPGEDDVIKNGRILGGIQPTRAFGDSQYKWSKEKSLALRKKFWAIKPKSQVKSAPYMTAEPVITTTKIEPEKGDFVVMASDGLWEMLSNEEVVGLVGKWMASEHGMNDKLPAKTWLEYLLGSSHKLPVVGGPLAARMEQDLEPDEEPDRPEQWGIKRRLNRFVVEDNNVATHLARNALGGDNHDLVAGLLALPTSNSRRFRDDLTITVIFFGNDQRGAQTFTVEKTGVKQDVEAKL